MKSFASNFFFGKEGHKRSCWLIPLVGQEVSGTFNLRSGGVSVVVPATWSSAPRWKFRQALVEGDVDSGRSVERKEQRFP